MPRPISEGQVPWPEEFAATYRSAGIWIGRTLGSSLWEVADAAPDRLALIDAEVRLTYRELIDRADACSSRLLHIGLAPGDRLLVQLPNGWEIVVLTLACMRLGVVPVMMLPGHRHHELSHLAQLSEAVAIAVPATFRGFDHQDLAARLARESEPLHHVLVAGKDVVNGHHALDHLLAPSGPGEVPRADIDDLEPMASDVAVLLLSGGTTGLPKLIARTHDDYRYNAHLSAEHSALDHHSVYLVALPAGHNFPLACPGILGTFLVGGRVVMIPSPEPTQAFDAIEREGVTHTAVVPAVTQSWISHAETVGADALVSLTVLQVGGARLADEVARRVEPDLGCRLQQVFGMAEGLLSFSRLDDPEAVITQTQGRPISPYDEVLLVDEDDEPVGPGQAGSLLTRGPYTPRGYYRAAEHNQASFTSDGWYRSGDVCRWHESGNLVVEGRDKDMINRGGEKISAEEIENLIYQLTDVDRVAAVSMPDVSMGERVCVYIVPKSGREVGLEQIRRVMTEHGVAAYKLPDRMVTVGDLPETKVGKIDKKALRADIARRMPDPGH